jgi:hypothetical protein
VVVVPYTKSLWVDLPVRVDDPSSRDDRFILASKDGAFRVVRTIADDRIRGDRHLTLEFFGLEPGQSYTLTHEPGEGQPVRVMFENVSYEEIFPKSQAKKQQFEEPEEFGLDPEMWAPWIPEAQMETEQEGEEIHLHSSDLPEEDDGP